MFPGREAVMSEILRRAGLVAAKVKRTLASLGSA
jgi:hypothetical protein